MINQKSTIKNTSDLMKGRSIVLDTETTGLISEISQDDPSAEYDRIIEIGCVEVVNGEITGNNLHIYLDPEKETDYEAFKVHGLHREKLIDLSGNKKFRDKYQEFLDFIGTSPLVIHNAKFDMGFLNLEFKLLGFGENFLSKSPVFDTLSYARSLHPGSNNTLDYLCKRYKVDSTKRELHGALLDAELLAQVFVNMVVPKNDHIIQNSLPESAKINPKLPPKKTPIDPRLNERLNRLIVRADEDELENYNSMAKNQGLTPF